MADILKITTPLVDKTPMTPNKPPTDTDANFNLSEISKVVQTNPQSEILKQNTGNIDKQEAPNILLNLMKDPSVTVGFLKNIYMLEEIIKLLPVNNSTFTQEIQQLFDALMLKPNDITAELLRQENTSTAFKGELFDFLRNLVQKNERPEMRLAVANLLKAINGSLSQRSVLNSVSNNLSFLADSVRPSATLSQKLDSLAARFRLDNAASQFSQLKNEALALLKDVESSILYTPKLEKVLPILIYNLSRFNDNADFVQNATMNLLTMMDGEQSKNSLVNLLYNLLTGGSAQRAENSRVMDILAQIIGRQDAGLAQQLQQNHMDQPAGSLQHLPFSEEDFFNELDRALMSMDKNMLSEAELLEQQYLADVRAYGEETAEELRQGRMKKASGDKEQSLNLLNGDKIDKIVHSLLSSPCNFTPLLHFIIPVLGMDLRSFAEIWIDPNDDDPKKPHGGADAENIHMLIVFDIEGIGRFEAELFVRKKEIILSLLCPPAYVDEFSKIGTGIARAAAKTGYRFADIQVARMERPRSLMDVFKTLPHRRTGIDVKI